MSTSLIFPGYKSTNPSPYRNYAVTERDKALINDQHFKVLFDPAFALTGDAPVNLCDGTASDLDSGTINVGAFGSGRAAFNTVGSEITLHPLVDFPAAEWTCFWVAEPKTPTSGTASHELIFGGAPTGAEYRPRMGFNAGATAARIFRGDTEIRLAHTPGSAYLDNGERLMMYTFSQELGLKIFENNVEVADDATDTTVLTNGLDAGVWQMMYNFQGLAGMQGVLDIDLSRQEWAFRRAAMWSYLSGFYGLS